MTLFVFLCVLGSSFFQAGWNFATKKSHADKVALLAIGWFCFGILMLPFIYVFYPLNALSEIWWQYCLASGVIHAFYLCFLGWGYSIGEISVVYPIARGLGIAGTTLLSLLIGIHSPSNLGYLGIGSIFMGIMLIGYKDVATKEKKMAYSVSILIALTVSCYSIVDSMGAKIIPPFILLASMNILAPIIALPYLYSSRRNGIIHALKFHKLEAFTVALAGTIAYAIILWAYKNAPVSYVASIREFSIIIATLLGVFILKEKLTLKKTTSIVLILLGIILIKIS